MIIKKYNKIFHVSLESVNEDSYKLECTDITSVIRAEILVVVLLALMEIFSYVICVNAGEKLNVMWTVAGIGVVAMYMVASSSEIRGMSEEATFNTENGMDNETVGKNIQSVVERVMSETSKIVRRNEAEKNNRIAVKKAMKSIKGGNKVC